MFTYYAYEVVVPQGIYEAVWCSRWKVALRLDDLLFADACDGNVQARGKIVHRFKNRCKKVHTHELKDFIDWDDQLFEIRRVRDAPAPSPQAPGLAVLDQQICPCTESCVLCDRNDHGWCTDSLLSFYTALHLVEVSHRNAQEEGVSISEYTPGHLYSRALV